MKYASAGWEKVSCAIFMAAWKLRDARDRAVLPGAPAEQVAGDVPPGGVMERLGGGMVRFKG